MCVCVCVCVSVCVSVYMREVVCQLHFPSSCDVMSAVILSCHDISLCYFTNLTHANIIKCPRIKDKVLILHIAIIKSPAR